MTSIQDRIAALNMGHVGRMPDTPSSRPPPPPRPDSEPTLEQDGHGYQEMERQAVGNMPQRAPEDGYRRSEPKRLPMPPPRPTAPRRQSSQASQGPALPPRKNSETALVRKTSQESVASTRSTHSTMSGLTPITSNTSRRTSFDTRGEVARIRAPAVSDPSLLPPLPPKKGSSPKPPLTHTKSSPDINKQAAKPQLPNRPPPLPQRKASADTNGQADELPELPVRRPSQPSEPQASRRTVPPKRSPLDFGLNKSTEAVPPIPQRPGQSPSSNTSDPNPHSSSSEPPPIPLSSKPNLANLQASKPTATAATTAPVANMPSKSQSGCLICRDFSAPDKHAARFPRESIPTQDLRWLAQQLTSPFPSATDKARAIFTWLHHNIAYNIEAFLNNNVRHTTPAQTIATGLAVCEGYAGTFTALASQVGLESVVVSGHGKGFGYQALKPGQPVPEFSCGHAWTAVKIDDGEWKLIDCCWGAGQIDSTNTYRKNLATEQFTMSNNDFGISHFPQNPNHFYRTDGQNISWEQYFMGPFGQGEDVQACGRCIGDHGVSPRSFLPVKKHIKVTGADPKKRIQFQCSKVCEHWDNERNGAGKPCVLILALGAKGGKPGDHIPMQTNGSFWWCDVATGELGSPGQTVILSAVLTANGKSARGWTVEEYKKKKHTVGMSWEGLAAWQLV